MKKFLVIVLILTSLSATAKDRVILNEDFNWVTWTGNLTDCAYNTTGELRIDKWSDEDKARGWTSVTTFVYTRPYFLKLGKTNYGGDVCSPALTALNDEEADVTLTFQAVSFSNSSGTVDPGLLHVAVLNAGEIVKISGGMQKYNTDAIDNSYKLSAYPSIKSSALLHLDPANSTGAQGTDPSACWTNEVSKYTIKIKGATSKTRILFVGGTYNGGPTDRPCIDNVKVTARVKVDPHDFSTIITKNNGKVMAVKNSDVKSIIFDYSAYVEDNEYYPDTVYTIKYEFIDNKIPETVKSYNYTGERISFADTQKFGYDIVATNCVSGQSGAAYGDYLFVVKDKLAAIYMYNLNTKKMVCSRSLTPHSETVSASSSTVLYHCNQSTFGTLKYDEKDPFPLLYVSQRPPSSTNRCFVNVLRIVPVMNTAGTEYTSFTVEEVQTIHLPKQTKGNALGNANFTIDPQTGEFYSYSRNNTQADANYLNCRITKFKSVDLTEPEVYLEDSDILESYEIFALNGKENISALNMQGGFIMNKKLYISQGYPSCGFIYLRVVDLEKKQLVNDIDLLKNGFPYEPEGCFYYKGHIMMSTNSSPLYEFYFN